MIAQSPPPADRLLLWTLSHDEALRAVVEELALQADHSIHWGELGQAHDIPAAILVDLRHGGRSAGTVSALRCDPRLLQLPILVLVDDEDDATVRDALGAGADDFLRRSWLERELPLRLATQGKAALVRRELLSRERDLQTLVELTRSFAGALDRTSLLADVTSRLAGELGLRRCSVVLLQAGGQQACVAASSDTDDQPNRIIDLSLYPEIRRALDKGTPVVVEDPRAHPLLDSVKETAQASIPGGLAVLPLLWEGEALGVLILRANAIRSFTSRELDFATTVANATSVALRNVGSLEELQQTKNFLEQLIASSVDGIIAADMNGRIMVFNPGAERLLGHRAEDVIGSRHVTSLYPDRQAFEVMQRLRSAQAGEGSGGRLAAWTVEVSHASGERIPVQMTAALIGDRENPLGSVGIFTDLRDRLRIEGELSATRRKLEEAARRAMIVELAGAAAHELNQPLTSVLGWSELLIRKVEEQDPQYRPLSIIRREAERMADVVRKLGRITRHETTEYVGDTRILDLDKATGEG